jgi:hypothetical protein
MDTLYRCRRCGYAPKSKPKFSLIRHLQRDRPCEVEYEDVPVDVLLSSLTFIPGYEERRHVCEYCQKRFAHASAKCKHKKTCPHKIRKTPPPSSSQQSSAGIRAFGNEVLDHLTDAFKAQCVRRTDKGFVELVEKIHFDPAKPENRNVKISNLKHNFVRVHNGTKWMYHKKKDILKQLVEHGKEILVEYFEDHELSAFPSLSPSMQEHIRGWMNRLDADNKRMLNSLEESVYLMILNNRIEESAGASSMSS